MVNITCNQKIQTKILNHAHQVGKIKSENTKCGREDIEQKNPSKNWFWRAIRLHLISLKIHLFYNPDILFLEK